MLVQETKGTLAPPVHDPTTPEPIPETTMPETRPDVTTETVMSLLVDLPVVAEHEGMKHHNVDLGDPKWTGITMHRMDITDGSIKRSMWKTVLDNGQPVWVRCNV